MKIGIDSYSYHRYFGEIYPNQADPGKRISYIDYLKTAIDLGVDGVSMETCFFESTEESYLKGMKELIQEGGFESVVAWGHPDGLEGGNKPEELEDLKRYIPVCETLGTEVLRVVGSSLAFRNEPHGPQIKKLIELFKEPAKMAADKGIKLAMENHFDFTTDEIGEIVEGVGADNFGITFDTGNALRIGDDPVEFAEKLGKYIFATHTKDVAPLYGGNPKDWFFFACVPVGKGVVDMPRIAKTLLDKGYRGMFAIEIDYLHTDYDDEFPAVEESVEYLRSLDL
jgi:sugar phosphate isomerase/epimerase